MVLVDIHCHILPGIDDGARDWMTSMKLAREAVQNGVTHAIVTPHTLNGKYLNHKKDVIRLTENFQEMIDEAGLPLQVFPGMEVRINVFYSVMKMASICSWNFQVMMCQLIAAIWSMNCFKRELHQ